MKKILMLLFSITLLSCSGDSSDGSSSGSVKWNFKADGVQYQWSGSYPNAHQTNSGKCFHATGPIVSFASPSINSIDRQVMLSFWFDNESTGTYYIDDIAPGNSATLFLNGANGQQYRASNDAVITLKITQIATLEGRITKGTFSGTLVDVYDSSNTIEITEGSFEAFRYPQ